MVLIVTKGKKDGRRDMMDVFVSFRLDNVRCVARCYGQGKDLIEKVYAERENAFS